MDKTLIFECESCSDVVISLFIVHALLVGGTIEE